MTKKQIKQIKYCFLEKNIDNMISQLQDWKNDGWGVVDDAIYIGIYRNKLESDEEYNHRMSNEKLMEERAKARRRKQYEELREEFGND